MNIVIRKIFIVLKKFTGNEMNMFENLLNEITHLIETSPFISTILCIIILLYIASIYKQNHND